MKMDSHARQLVAGFQLKNSLLSVQDSQIAIHTSDTHNMQTRMQQLGPRRPDKLPDPKAQNRHWKQQQPSVSRVDSLPRIVHDDKHKRRVRAQLVGQPDSRPARAVEQDAEHRDDEEQMVVACRAEEA